VLASFPGVAATNEMRLLAARAVERAM